MSFNFIAVTPVNGLAPVLIQVDKILTITPTPTSEEGTVIALADQVFVYTKEPLMTIVQFMKDVCK